MNPKGHVHGIQDAQDSEPRPVRRVFGEPYQEGSTTIIPVATVRGNSRLRPRFKSQGNDPTSSHSSLSSIRPIGVYVVTNDGVVWRPSLDLNQVIRGGQAIGALTVIAATYLLGRKLFRRRL